MKQVRFSSIAIVLLTSVLGGVWIGEVALAHSPVESPVPDVSPLPPEGQPVPPLNYKTTCSTNQCNGETLQCGSAEEACCCRTSATGSFSCECRSSSNCTSPPSGWTCTT